jgi:hypothetical protein
MKTIQSILLVLLILVALGLFVHRFGFVPNVRPSIASTSAKPWSELKERKGTGIIYKFTPENQKRLIQTVRHFCVDAYHAESCVQYLATCGQPCLIGVPPEYRKRIFEDYQTFRKKEALPPIQHVEDED